MRHQKTNRAVKSIQKIQENTLEEYKEMNEEEFAILYMKHIGKKVKY